MPIVTESVVTISCDNPTCPGNALDPNDRTGWTFVTTEVYGETTTQFVYCCADCAGTVGTALAVQAAARAARDSDLEIENTIPV